jgi:hypothetical protein
MFGIPYRRCTLRFSIDVHEAERRFQENVKIVSQVLFQTHPSVDENERNVKYRGNFIEQRFWMISLFCKNLYAPVLKGEIQDVSEGILVEVTQCIHWIAAILMTAILGVVLFLFANYGNPAMGLYVLLAIGFHFALYFLGFVLVSQRQISYLKVLWSNDEDGKQRRLTEWPF